MPHAASPKKARSRKDASVDPRFDWRRIAYHVLVSRALDDLEEATNRNRGTVPREHQVLYQFSARGHDVGQVILGSLLERPHDGVGAYYRSRPILLSLGLPIVDALASPLGRSGGFSDGRDIGVVCNLPGWEGPTVLPMASGRMPASTVRWSAHLLEPVPPGEEKGWFWYEARTVHSGGGYATSFARLYSGGRLVVWSEQLMTVYDRRA